MTRVRCMCACLIVGGLLTMPGHAQVVMGPGEGAPPIVNILRADGTVSSFFAYGQAFAGGVRVAVGDVNGDGVPDIITGAGPGGGPHVRVVSGVDFSEIASFFAYDASFSGGVFVAAGDVNGDGFADIITGAGAGGAPHVCVFSGAFLSGPPIFRSFSRIASFFAYAPNFFGGVSVAAGDVNGDGKADIITGAGPGGGPHVQVLSGDNLSVILASFFAYDASFRGGVFVASGDINGDGRADIITGAGSGGSPHVKVFSGANLSELASFFAYTPVFGGGVRVAAVDVDGDRRPELVTAAGPGGGPHVRVFNATTLSELGGLYAFAPTFSGGVFAGSFAGAGPFRIASPNSASFRIGTPQTFTVSTSGGSGPITLALAPSLPPGLMFTDRGNGSAIIAGTPGAGSAGQYPLTLSATAGSGASATQNFRLFVSEIPAITSADHTTFTVGAPGHFLITTAGYNVPTISVSGALPIGVGLSNEIINTITISGTPASGTAGVYPLTITVTDILGVIPSATQNFTLTVQ
jgi:Putative Ig domain/FG-GAP-like repeat/FG-GAP repeat